MSSSKIQELQAKVVTLEEERTILEPLIEVGVAVRKRVFEQAKYAVSLGEIFSRADHKIIREGNDHCHRAKCLADAAIFKLFYLSGSSNEALYNKIYYIDSQADHYFTGEPSDMADTGEWGRSAEEPDDMAGTGDWTVRVPGDMAGTVDWD
ncbi:uncharacterized protein EAF01_007457 [Botrytis porri]|uniref:uncharacterized protein n=1 Tax=Botrytis porri TaxID=87229 RepID=UPI0019002618|nr:uncharacterized protein EAF01_007457 [Botrytis porri]KAF7902159.1 hypothetical protein EAF01_007457 [Botrytis porri]